MTTETSFFRKSLIILSGLFSTIGVIGGVLDVVQKFNPQQTNDTQRLIDYNAQQALLQRQAQQQEAQRRSEDERQAEAQRLINYGAQQALLQMQAQQQETQRRTEEARQAEAQRLIEQNAQQALLQMQVQQQEAERRTEEARQTEAQRLIEQNAQQALLQMQAQQQEAQRRSEEARQAEAQQQETQRVLERKTQVLETVQSYFEFVNRHQITQVMHILANPTDKTRKVLENTEWVRLNDIALVNADNEQAIVNVRFQGKSKDSSVREYTGSIPLQWLDHQWKIITLTKLQQVSNTIEPPVADHHSYQKGKKDENKVDSLDESVANAPSVTSGDRYIYESIYPNNSKINNKTERIVASVTNKKILLYSKNLTSDFVRQLEYTPEWNFLSSKSKDGSGLTYNPPLKYFEFPLTTGDSWSQDSIETNIKTGKKRKHSISTTVGDWEQVAVPAGTFRAIKITAQTNVIDLETGKPIIGKDISWYSPDVGRSVKSLITSTNPDGQQEKQIIQLLEYHSAETPD
ncbi:hypothetical protein [Chromatium okenii]|uniref:Uncharacterized protein n=1 Tax=Chromatium okenii TaxID=61644 RepID=A0A2S7XP86_9GAMM|nr:hypothetical protein [Chromatium okenii]MBV5311364.1 hypothetical protein [Chromatium okenii]PQJ95549.1 hypothetical protein CXB77_15575 [Chromatium okenii]